MKACVPWPFAITVAFAVVLASPLFAGEYTRGAITPMPDGGFAVLTSSGNVVWVHQDGRVEKICALSSTRGAGTATAIDVSAHPETGTVYALLASPYGESSVVTCTVGKELSRTIPLPAKGSFSSILATRRFLVVVSSRTGQLLTFSEQGFSQDQNSLSPRLNIPVRAAERITAIAYDSADDAVLALDGIGGAVYRINGSGAVSVLTENVEGAVSMAFDSRAGKLYFLTEGGQVVGISLGKDAQRQQFVAPTVKLSEWRFLKTEISQRWSRMVLLGSGVLHLANYLGCFTYRPKWLISSSLYMQF
jgi:hypothetical protein